MPPHAFTHADSSISDVAYDVYILTTTCHSIDSCDESDVVVSPQKPLSQQIPCSIPTTRRNKQVSFALENNQVFDVIHIDDLEQEMDISEIWYTRDEFRQITRECVRTVSQVAQWLLEEKKSLDCCYDYDNDEHCSRGLELEIDSKLERLDIDYVSVRHNRIQSSKAAVFEEQSVQRTEGINNVDLLSAMYNGCSFECQIEAEEVAEDDYYEVLDLQD